MGFPTLYNGYHIRPCSVRVKFGWDWAGLSGIELEFSSFSLNPHGLTKHA